MSNIVKPVDIFRSFNIDFERSAAPSSQFEMRLGDIISGNIAPESTFKWGLEVKSDVDRIVRSAADGRVNVAEKNTTIGSQDSNFFRILNITEGNQADDNIYTLTYVFLQKTSETSRQDLDYFAYCKENIGKFKQIESGLESSLQAVRNTKDSKYPGVASFETTALMRVLDLWKKPSSFEDNVFASVLLFCKHCETGNSVLSVIFGNIESVVIDDDIHDLHRELVDTLDTLGASASFTDNNDVSRKVTFESIVSDFLIRRRGNLPRYAMKWATYLWEQYKADPGFYRNKTRMSRFLKDSSPCIDVPHFDYIGNTELASEYAISTGATSLSGIPSPHASTRRETMHFRTMKRRAKVEDLNRALTIGSCSLNMSFTLRQLRVSSPILYLKNMGGARGCRCYLNAAETNNYELFILNGAPDVSSETTGDDGFATSSSASFDPFAPDGLEQLKSLLEAVPFSESFAFEKIRCGGHEKRFDNENYLYFIDKNVLKFIFAERKRILRDKQSERKRRST